MQGASTDRTFESLIYSYGAMKTFCYCVCRATPNGKEGDPAACETYANNLLSCYANMVQTSKKQCQKQYMSVYECLKKHETEESSGSVCSKNLDEFANCI